jgi:hypothetical protein
MILFCRSLFFRIFAPEIKRIRIMTALQKEGWAAAAKQAHADGQDKLMAEDIFADETMEDWK